MSPLQFLQEFALSDSEAMQRDRGRVMVRITPVIVLVLAPFLVYALFQGRFVLPALGGVLLVAMVADALALRRGARPPVSFPLLFLPILVGIAATVVTMGIIGALWSFPALIIGYFVLSRRAAFFCSLLLIVTATALTALYVGAELALRVGASQSMTWIMINIVLNVLNEAHRDMLRLAIMDPLTGALNRRQLDLTLGQMVNRARRRSVPASIVLIDIDNFKQINDSLGHATGDQVLVGIVKLMSERKRTADSLYRLGGEEFLLLAPDTTGPDASFLAEQLRALVEKANFIEGLQVQVSIGVSECRTDQSAQEWLECADQALYRAKEGGRNRVETSVFSDSAFKLSQERSP